MTTTRTTLNGTHVHSPAWKALDCSACNPSGHTHCKGECTPRGAAPTEHHPDCDRVLRPRGTAGPMCDCAAGWHDPNG